MRMNFCRIMAAMSLRYGNNVAIVNVERARRYTFREYHLLTNRIADAMRNKLGLRKDDNVLMMLDNDNLSLLHFPLSSSRKRHSHSATNEMLWRSTFGSSII
jgi:fatty-acyl-CoA synthase